MPVHIHAWQQVGMGCLSYSCVALEEPSPISCHLVPFLPRIRLSVSSPVRVPETQAALLRYAVLPGQKQHSTTRTYTGTRCAHQHHDKQCINTTTSSASAVVHQQCITPRQAVHQQCISSASAPRQAVHQQCINTTTSRASTPRQAVHQQCISSASQHDKQCISSASAVHHTTTSSASAVVHQQCINTTTSSALKVLSAKASPRHKNKHVIAAAPFKRATVECAAIDRI